MASSILALLQTSGMSCNWAAAAATALIDTNSRGNATVGASASTTAQGDDFGATNTGDTSLRGGDAVSCNGTTQYLSIPSTVIADLFAAGSFSLGFFYKYTNTAYTTIVRNGHAESAALHGAFGIGFSEGSFVNNANKVGAYLLRAGTQTGAVIEYNDSQRHLDGQWNHICVTYNSGTDTLSLFANGVAAGTPAVVGGTLPTARAFLLGALLGNATPQDFGPITVQWAHCHTAAITVAQVRAIEAAFHGRNGRKIYASATETGAERANRFVSAGVSSGMDCFQIDDSNGARSSTTEVAAGATYNSTNTASNANKVNRDQGNMVSRARMLRMAAGKSIRALTVGATNPSRSPDAYYLGVYNSLVATSVEPTGITHVLARDVAKWNRDSAASYSGGSATTGWQLDTAYKASGTQVDAATTGLILDPTLPEWPFDPFDDLEIVVNYATFASGGGTIYPEVIKVSDSSVVTASTAIACTGSDGWATTPVAVGRITEAVRFRLQGSTAATTKFAIGPCTIRAKNRTGGFTLQMLWAFGSQDIQMPLRSLVQDSDTYTRLVATLSMVRAATGSGHCCFIIQQGQNARNLKSDTLLDLAYNTDLTQNAVNATYRAGNKLNHLAARYQLNLAAVAAGYTAGNIWFLYDGYFQIASGGDYQMENQLQRAIMEISADGTDLKSIVIDGIETIGEYTRFNEVGGYSISGSSVDPAHASRTGQEMAGQAKGMVLASGTARNPGTSRTILPIPMY